MILTVLGIVWDLIKVVLNMFKYVAIPIGVYVVYLFISVLIVKKYLSKRGVKATKQVKTTIKRKGLFYNLLIKVPYRYAYDLSSREPYFFPYQGIHMFCGEQGSGKSIAMVEMIFRLQKACDKAKVITNFDYEYQDDDLTDWRQLLDYTNGKQGVIVGIDEIQNWFASGKNQLPPQMLEVCTQNRKNRRVLYCTAQVFTRVNKAIREQVTLVYRPHTFLGCFTVVRIDKPIFDSEGNVKQYKLRGFYHFVHTKEIRDSFDTYKVIHSLSKDGFKDTNILVDKNA